MNRLPLSPNWDNMTSVTKNSSLTSIDNFATSVYPYQVAFPVTFFSAFDRNKEGGCPSHDSSTEVHPFLSTIQCTEVCNENCLENIYRYAGGLYLLSACAQTEEVGGSSPNVQSGKTMSLWSDWSA
jgi:hypothetical protein